MIKAAMSHAPSSAASASSASTTASAPPASTTKRPAVDVYKRQGVENVARDKLDMAAEGEIIFYDVSD